MIKAGEELLRLQAENQRLKEGIKQAREEMDRIYEDLDGYDPQALGDYASHVDKILDKLIAESEG